MHTVFGLNYFVFCFLLLIVVLYLTKDLRDDGYLLNVSQEPFESPGDSRVDINRKPDQDLEDEKQKRLTELALRDMTDAGAFTSDYAPAPL